MRGSRASRRPVKSTLLEGVWSRATWANAGLHSGDREIHGKDGVAGSIPAGGSTPNQQLRPGTMPGLLYAESALNHHLPEIYQKTLFVVVGAPIVVSGVGRGYLPSQGQPCGPEVIRRPPGSRPHLTPVDVARPRSSAGHANALGDLQDTAERTDRLMVMVIGCDRRCVDAEVVRQHQGARGACRALRGHGFRRR
jgi:hypothetical protein